MAGFLVIFFLVSVSHEMKHENSANKSGIVRGKIRGKNFEFCNFSDLRDMERYREREITRDTARL